MNTLPTLRLVEIADILGVTHQRTSAGREDGTYRRPLDGTEFGPRRIGPALRADPNLAAGARIP